MDILIGEYRRDAKNNVTARMEGIRITENNGIDGLRRLKRI